MQITFTPGTLQSIATQRTPFFASPEIPQTVVPDTYGVNVNGTANFTANQPAVWTTDIGSIVAAPDGLSATFTAPATPGTATITATNENDPSDTATAQVAVIAAPTPTARSVQVVGPDSGVYGDGPFVLQG